MRNFINKLSMAVCLTAIALSAANAEEYKVGVVQSLTGALAFVGVPLVNGMKLAAEEVNEKQLLGAGNKLTLLVQDDEVNRSQAVSLVKRFAADPSIVAILGPTTTTTAIPGAQAANESKIVALVTTNSPEIAKTGPYGFRLSQGPVTQMEPIARYAIDVLKIKQCALIGVLDGAAYVEQTQAFQDHVTREGVEIIAREGVKQADTDFSAISAKIAAMNPECVFISAIAATGANLIIQLRQAGLSPDTKILGMNSMSSSALIEVGGEAVNGLYLTSDWLAGGANTEGHQFAARYKEAYGVEPDTWGPMGYGAVMVMANAIRASQPEVTRDSLRKSLAETKDFPILLGSGKFTYDADRAPIYGTNILQVQQGKFVLAPR